MGEDASLVGRMVAMWEPLRLRPYSLRALLHAADVSGLPGDQDQLGRAQAYRRPLRDPSSRISGKCHPPQNELSPSVWLNP
jgi:hypothetical protein